ncbi:MAG: tRNA preQ1(34) S-adenosylmethionine ribosyltransferase-isomerase QueA [Syntrophomonadaceae bacterium]|jgi:S-adenosylmethionine:tRNA ribosyltransferase-isomerase
MTQDQNIFALSNYYFDLPSNLIAQYPTKPRDEARLLVLNRSTGSISDTSFKEITRFITPGDTLVLNKTRVIPARLWGKKLTGAKVEILLLRKIDDRWESLVKPARKLRAGDYVLFDKSEVRAEIIAEMSIPGGRIIRFDSCSDEQAFIEQFGCMPLPPYINREAQEEDREDYQTVYAEVNGSAAAPTAGLHFTQELLKQIEDQGINIARVLLHVGLGTFRPVEKADIREHKMHSEFYVIDNETAQLLNQTRKKGKSVIAVGTTVVRSLETVYNDDYGFLAQSGETDKFIYPGYKFRAVDKLVTNFHLPGSSLVMLVSAFAGIDQVKAAYKHAIDRQYKFFSYGDAMLII